MADLNTNVLYIKGIGEERAKALKKLGIATLRDLIAYFPRTYEDRRTAKEIAALQDGESACVQAMVDETPTLNRVRQGMELVKAEVSDGTGKLFITFFNQSYRKNSLRVGEEYVFYGKAEGAGRRKSMVNPLVEPPGTGVLTGRIVPIYPLSAGITQTMLIRAVRQGLDACGELLEDPLPEDVRREHRLCRVEYAYQQIHFPDGEEELAVARRRLAFEELFLLAVGIKKLRSRREGCSCRPYENLDLGDFYGELPFALTGAQRRAIGEILADFSSGRPMNRLVQGDVGSGKTMVAAAAIACAVKNGAQAALMAPTEILAEQHHRGLSPLLESLGIPCALLTGAIPAKTRREVLDRLERGEVRVLIGTHALIGGGVSFQNLGLVVTDEQHRFGVAQRAALSAKGEQPHLLVMSATPIPRTLALLIYGELDVSIIDELPPGRQEVKTLAVTGRQRGKVYQSIARQIAAGRQAYIVCSMVDAGDAPADDRKAASAYAKMLQEQVFPNLRVACVHGRMKPKEKEAVMAAFSAGEIHILVSTTVVEVGVDVPNATVMVVEDAERFGLSQLHQLRGRVGRGQHQSYCVLISDNQGEEAKARLKIMEETSDGFKIAEEDLRLRGPGDFFGQRQHGLPALKAADLACDAALLKEAQTAAGALLDRDPELAAHPAVSRRLAELFETGGGALN